MENKKGLMMVLATAVISGFSIFINSYGVKGFDSSVFTFSKNLVVAIALFALMVGIGQWKELKVLSRKQWQQLTIIGLIGGSIPFLLFFKGLQLASGATASFIHKTLFIYAALGAVVFLREKLSKIAMAGAGLLLIGNYIALMPQFSFSFGHVLIFIAVLFWAAENVYAKHVLKNLSGTVVSFGRMFFGSLIMFLFLVATSKTSLVWSMSFAQYSWIGITSLLLLMYVFTYYNGLKEVKVSTATAILAIGSVITTLLDIAFKGTAVSLPQAVAMVLMLVGASAMILYSSPTATVQEQKA